MVFPAMAQTQIMHAMLFLLTNEVVSLQGNPLCDMIERLDREVVVACDGQTIEVCSKELIRCWS